MADTALRVSSMADRDAYTKPKKRKRSDLRTPWNKGRQVGQKPALRPSEVRAIRRQLKGRTNLRDRVLFELAIDSKLRGCDLVALRPSDVTLPSGEIRSRTTVLQSKTSRAVQFEWSTRTRHLVAKWLSKPVGARRIWLFPSDRRVGHITTRQYARLVDRWVQGVGLDPSLYGTHSLRRTKVAYIYRETRNIRAIQLLLGHSSLEHTLLLRLWLRLLPENEAAWLRASAMLEAENIGHPGIAEEVEWIFHGHPLDL